MANPQVTNNVIESGGKVRTCTQNSKFAAQILLVFYTYKLSVTAQHDMVSKRQRQFILSLKMELILVLSMQIYENVFGK